MREQLVGGEGAIRLIRGFVKHTGVRRADQLGVCRLDPPQGLGREVLAQHRLVVLAEDEDLPRRR
eukprot:4384417-Prymnesium_polylepis.1